jgi:hypothetical protein
VVTAPPPIVAEEFLAAIASIDTATLHDLVEPDGLAILAGVENRVRSDEMVALLETGLEENLAAGYWQSFRDDFAAIRGIPIDTLSVGGERPEDLGSDYAAVVVSGGGTDGVVVLRLSEEQGWQVDMIATIGPALVNSLVDYLESALGGASGEVIAEAYRWAVLPGLDAAIVLDPGNATLVFSTETIREMLPEPESSGG